MKKTFLFAIFAVLLQSAAAAQSLRLGVEGGALIAMGPDEFKNSAPGGLGMKNGLSFGLKGKYETPLSSFRFTAHINYSSFSAEEDYLYREPAQQPDLSFAGYYKVAKPAAIKADIPSDMHSEVSSNIITIGAGAEWKITDWKASPYLAGGVFLNYYDTNDKERNIISNIETEYKDSGTRIGGYLGAGAEIKLLDRLSLDVSAKYNFYSLMNTSDMEDFVGEANNGLTAVFIGAAVMWRVF